MGDKYKSAVHGISVLILKGLSIHCESIPLVFLVDYSREQVVLFLGLFVWVFLHECSQDCYLYEKVFSCLGLI